MSSSTYLLAGQASELERLQLQSRVWEPSGRRLLAEIGDGRGGRAVDIGYGVMGWLGLLSEWVGQDAEGVGTDIDDAMLCAAEQFVAEAGLGNVLLRNDDLFATRLEPASFDLVHARFELTPLGRGHDQMETYVRLLRPGGTIVLEDPDWGSWHFNPRAEACQKLIALIHEAFVSGTTIAVVRERGGVAPAPSGRRERASRTRSLGHHVHVDPVLGPDGDIAACNSPEDRRAPAKSRIAACLSGDTRSACGVAVSRGARKKGPNQRSRLDGERTSRSRRRFGGGMPRQRLTIL